MPKLGRLVSAAMESLPSAQHGATRVVNVHQAKTHLSRLIDDAHAGETILLAKAGKPWARLMPLAPPPPQRIPGRLRSQEPLGNPDALLAPMAADELASWESGLLLPEGLLP
jgi:prevent-host-death family protein